VFVDGVDAEGVVPVNRVSTLRAPAGNGAVVAEPPLSAVGALLEENRRRDPGPRLRGLLHRPDARRAVLDAARRYMQGFGEPLPDVPADAPIIAAGHQPELFHPGVWVKNFALHGLAHRHHLAAVNLVVDNDTVKSTSIHAPAWTVQGPDLIALLTAEQAEYERRKRIDEASEEWHAKNPKDYVASIPFDRWTSDIPWEERGILDQELFKSFPERVRRESMVSPSILRRDYWKDVLRIATNCSNLGCCFAAARRALERRWGCHNFEVPVSAVCATEPFARFACDLLTALSQFRQVHNDTLAAYRRANKVRSGSRPIPDLAAEGDWLEAPFWGWRAGQPRRGRLMVRRTADRLELRAGAEQWPSLPFSATDPSILVRAWRELEPAGYKVRSRALTNTLFARLFFADLFIHGIGGGKYDEITDGIIRRFYECEPPNYLVLSATRLLPLVSYTEAPEECRRYAREIRDIYWNPQRYRTGGEEKQAWIDKVPTTKAERRERFEKLRELTAHLREPLTEELDRWRTLLAICLDILANNAVKQRRDYPFVLYDEETLRPFCTQFL
jgi:hypothetical protein